MPFPIVTGVYLTSRGPERGKASLNKNNWARSTIIKKKLEAYVKIEVNKNDPHLKDVSEDDRDIFLYTNDLDLQQYSYEIRSFS